MAHPNSTIKFPLWKFLNQPLFGSQAKPILNPRYFWYRYQVELLRRCWDKDLDYKGRRN